MHHPNLTIESGENELEKNLILSKMHRRRNFQRQACVISVMAAFVIGLSLGVFVPVFGVGTAISSEFNDRQLLSSRSLSNFDINRNWYFNHNNLNNNNDMQSGNDNLKSDEMANHMGDLRFAKMHDIQGNSEKFRESYAETRPTEYVRNKNDLDSSVNLDSSDRIIDSNDHLLTGYLARVKTRKVALNRSGDGKNAHIIKQQRQQHQFQPLSFFTNSFERLNQTNNNKNSQIDYLNESKQMPNEFNGLPNDKLLPNTDENNNNNNNSYDVIEDDIYWGKVIENAMPIGYSTKHVNDWNNYVNENRIVKLEIGCGRMQNRLITFQNGRKACARYRQNTDQIQGELFSFYLGRLLNLTNLAPSVPSIIDLNSTPWLSAAQDIQAAQWKSQRPVVLTEWIDNLESANIPVLFQSMERHVNKYDVKNIALGLDFKATNLAANRLTDMKINKTVKQKLIELVQWSDLIIFDYLIANLDRVVNNLYNFQWNADIMAAPAHNLARQSDSQLLVFLDNESGLLHGYRLLKKYETYHGLLLDNLCVFRRPTIVALQQLQNDGIGKRLQQLFEQSTTDKVRDILPSLPDKSIKILVDRIDHVLSQVQKCRELFQSR